MMQDNIVNDYLKGCVELRTTLHRLVYSEYTLFELEKKILNKFEDKILECKSNTNKLETTFSYKKEDNTVLSIFTDLFDEYIIERIQNNKVALIDYNKDLEVIIDKIESRELSMSNLYNILAITTDKSYDITLQL